MEGANGKVQFKGHADVLGEVLPGLVAQGEGFLFLSMPVKAPPGKSVKVEGDCVFRNL